jgi:hypothetical protein
MFKSLESEIDLSPFIYLYDVNTLRQFECTHAHHLIAYTKLSDYEKAFFLRNNRKPNKYDLEHMEFLKTVVNLPVDSDTHWNTYVSQAIYDDFGDLEVSSNIISKYYKEILKFDIDYDNLHEIGRYMRYKFGRLLTDNGYNMVNVWQLMQISAIIDTNNITKNCDNIIFIFNKIYKRKPLDQEVQIILCLDLDSGIQGVRNEIVKYFKVAYEYSFRRRRLTRH